MELLRGIVESCGGSNVVSIGQSGNLVFDATGRSWRSRLEDGIEDEVGFRPRVLVLTAVSFRAIAEADPFRANAVDGKHVHTWFLTREAKQADLASIQSLARESEAFHLTKPAFYLHAPEGMGRSKLAEKVESLLGVDATARNGNTIAKLLAKL